jgi:ATP-dependent RNA helicase RhlE
MTSTFADLGLREELLAALTHAGYSTPTPIQAQAIGPALKGRNILGLAQTGTGKTAAFALPILQHLASAPPPGRAPRALILAPTRELAIQILESVRGYGNSLRLRSMLIVGGASQNKQVNDLKRGVDIIIATPGRLEDLQKQRLIDLTHINHFVLDEADRMLDIGFFPAIRRIAATLPKQKQVMFFSATMPAQVADLAKQLLHDPVRVEVAPESTPVERITQQVIFVPQGEKRQVLIDLLADAKLYRVVVFTRTKHGADKVARTLERAGEQVRVMHGNKSQNTRQAALSDFERGKVRLLIATDIAARGIDVDDVTHVINFDIPNEPETYVHRIGRTARAGKSGIAISLCDNGEEKSWLRDIEKLTRQKIPAQERPPASGYKIPPPTAQDNARPARKPQQQPKRAPTATARPLHNSARPEGQRPQQPKKAGNWQKRKRIAQGKGRPQPRG